MLDFVFDRRSLRIGGIGASMTAAGFTEEAFAAQKALMHTRTKQLSGFGWWRSNWFETFHAPTSAVPTEWQPVNGFIYDAKTNINLGADWLELSKHTSKLNVVNSLVMRLFSQTGYSFYDDWTL